MGQTKYITVLVIWGNIYKYNTNIIIMESTGLQWTKNPLESTKIHQTENPVESTGLYWIFSLVESNWTELLDSTGLKIQSSPENLYSDPPNIESSGIW